ncbi:hypothetical protein OZX56_05380 [Lactobacillus sp. ESL0684]|uniref:hypothetical protein n=1 Tax=Lactobacillus sp. ESL0684 TaxID=2983213 RepID=UPI0023F9F3A7|nr:hypothetical protein [Lactobacillus sp. ESL0684]WEV42981.1 hypothetical protein OZX56_05380 [Lactobacillus sp. ESL0684]
MTDNRCAFCQAALDLEDISGRKGDFYLDEELGILNVWDYEAKQKLEFKVKYCPWCGRELKVMHG